MVRRMAKIGNLPMHVTMTKEEAKNHGFIARMNQRMRVPAHDATFIEKVKETSKSTKDWMRR